jgi:hypothetical protein
VIIVIAEAHVVKDVVVNAIVVIAEVVIAEVAAIKRKNKFRLGRRI